MTAAQTISQEDRSVGVDRVLSILRRRAWVVIPVGAAAVTATLSIAFFLPNLYRSSATVLVERQQVPEDFVRSTITREVDSRLQEISQQIMSRTRLVSLIEKHGLYAELRARRPIDEVMQRMRSDIRLELEGTPNVSARDGTVAFKISYTGRDPETVAAVTNELADSYIEEDLKVRERQATGTAVFLRGQLNDMKTQLETQERTVKEFKEQFMGELPQQENANLSALERLSAQLLLNSERQALAGERHATRERPPANVGDAAATASGSVAARLQAARHELADLRKRYTEKYPDVVLVRAEIAELERQVGADNGFAGNSIASDTASAVGGTDNLAASVELKVLKGEEDRLRRQIAEYEARIENTPRREQQFQVLRRDYETTQQVYESLLKRYEEAKLAESLEHNRKGEQFRILDTALVAERPVAPNRLRLILVGLMVSIGLAAMAAAVAETIDSSIHTVDELRAFSTVPVLVTIPRIVTEPDRRGEARRRWLAGASIVACLLVIVAASYFLARYNTRLVALLS
jgi:polysaccharide chain length determinant protein (PEP-CTERM system associated)